MYVASSERAIKLMMDLKGFGRKRSWLNFTVLPSIPLEGLRNTTKILSQDNRSPGRDLSPGNPEYEAGVLTIRPRRSVARCNIMSIAFSES
jgi:hypothetical protein